jgi:hypothetical protein
LELKFEELLDIVGSTFRHDIQNDIDIKGFNSEVAATIKSTVKTAKTAVKEEVNEIKGQFTVDKTSAGPVLPETFDVAAAAAATSISITLIDEADGTNTATCTVMAEADQITGCRFGPADDFKFRYMCGLGGSFNYGTENYTCDDANLPTSLFCDATV